MTVSAPTYRCALVALALGLSACHDAGADGEQTAAPASVRITVSEVDSRFSAREDFIAGGEMQISGEPLADAMGRDRGNYSRMRVPTDIYYDTSPLADGPWIDLAGYSSAVESYEYSKQPMNSLAFESGAGTSLVFGPLVNPQGVGGEEATRLLAARIERFARESHAWGRYVFPAGTFPRDNPRAGDTNPSGDGDPAHNPLGWPGIWPTTHVFRSFDPAIDPTSEIALQCSISSDDDPNAASNALTCPDYECDLTSLQLPDRAAQVDAVVTPGADGFSAWKYGLWVMNYLEIMHDPAEAAVAGVDPDKLAEVGADDNQIAGVDDAGVATGAGTYLGSSDIEGFQAALFIDEVDNRAQDWLEHLTTSDGQHLDGFASLRDALVYDYRQPARWFAGEVAVSEADDPSGFPRPSYSLSAPTSRALDLVGMAMGYSQFYALTDTANADVGGSQPARAYFDGDPFAADDQAPDAEATLHDRSLGIIRVAVVNLDRFHTDPETGYLVDEVDFDGASPTRGATVSATTAAYAVIGLRTVRRALSSNLQLYSNNTPDASVHVTPLDATPIHYPSDSSQTFTARLDAMIEAQSELLYDHLTDADGRAYLGWNVRDGAPTDDAEHLDAYTAAVRGLFAAYLASGDVRYRDRALAVFERMEQLFYDPQARIYSATPAPADSVTYTPLRFALLQSTLRDVYELYASRPGHAALRAQIESRIGRLNKLVLNGWDDRNHDRMVDWPDECVRMEQDLPRGGLQMAERTLTGEFGSFETQPRRYWARTMTADRDMDCVPEVDDAHLPAQLAGSVTFEIAREYDE